MLKQFKHISIKQEIHKTRAEERYPELVRSMQANKMTLRDDVTGLCTRRFLQGVLPIELNKAIREGVHLGLISIDIDFFVKKVLNVCNREAVNKVLKAVAIIIESECSEFDLPFCGHDSQGFFILTTSVRNILQLINLAHRIRRKVNTALFVVENKEKVQTTIQITMSFGIAMGSTDSIEINTAGAVLYSKLHGRDKIVIHDPDKIHKQAYSPNADEDFVVFID